VHYSKAEGMPTPMPTPSAILSDNEYPPPPLPALPGAVLFEVAGLVELDVAVAVGAVAVVAVTGIVTNEVAAVVDTGAVTIGNPFDAQ